jgi:Haem-NO-binding
MRGEIFNEFLEFAAESIGVDAAGTLVTPAGTAAGGYEAAGRYDLAELLHLVDQLAAARGEPRAQVLRSFGRHLFRYFAALYPTFLDEAGSALGVLAGIETYVHGELRKLYPDADFPRFECAPVAPDGLAMSYHSSRPLADLAEGLIQGCIEHFDDPVRVVREDLPGAPGTAARFVVIPERGRATFRDDAG